jgi:hypothetical protein
VRRNELLERRPFQLGKGQSLKLFWCRHSVTLRAFFFG